MSRKFLSAAALSLATAVTAVSLATPSAHAAQNKIMLVFDSSGSMKRPAGTETRMVAAKRAVGQVMGSLSPQTEIGLVAYGHRRGKDCSDLEVVAMPKLGQGGMLAAQINAMEPLGETPIAEAVKLAAETAQYDELPATVVLVTDGEESCGGDPCALGAALEGQGIDFTAHVIGFGYEGENKAGAACLAEQTGGQYLAAADADQLAAALVQVVSAPAAASSVFAEDTFDGTGLGETWEVINPDANAYIVEDGKVMSATSTASYLRPGKPQPNNIFKWNGGMPEGDFDISVDFTAEFAQSEKAILEVATYADQENLAVASMWRSGNSNNELWIQVIAAIDGKKSEQRLRVATGSCCPKTFDMDAVYKALETQGGTLTLQRRGRKVSTKLTLNGWTPNEESPGEFVTDEILVLRMPGDPVLFTGSWGGGDTNISYFDRFEIIGY